MGTFCYKVVHFRLKDVYVDDMIANVQNEDDHITNLQELFDRLRKFKLRLNPAKCTFGVRSGNYWGS